MLRTTFSYYLGLYIRRGNVIPSGGEMAGVRHARQPVAYGEMSAFGQLGVAPPLPASQIQTNIFRIHAIHYNVVLVRFFSFALLFSHHL